jgi:hypothetical protein
MKALMIVLVCVGWWLCGCDEPKARFVVNGDASLVGTVVFIDDRRMGTLDPVLNGTSAGASYELPRGTHKLLLIGGDGRRRETKLQPALYVTVRVEKDSLRVGYGQY